MCLCKVYNMDTSEFVGMNAYDKIQEQDNMKASIRLLKEQRYSAPKQLLGILLLALSPSEMATAMAFSTDAVSADSSPASSFMDYKNVMIATLLMLLCGALNWLFAFTCVLHLELREARTSPDQKLHQVLDILEYKMGWGIYAGKTETLQEKRRRYGVTLLKKMKALFLEQICEVSQIRSSTLNCLVVKESFLQTATETLLLHSSFTTNNS